MIEERKETYSLENIATKNYNMQTVTYLKPRAQRTSVSHLSVVSDVVYV